MCTEGFLWLRCSRRTAAASNAPIAPNAANASKATISTGITTPAEILNQAARACRDRAHWVT